MLRENFFSNTFYPGKVTPEEEKRDLAALCPEQKRRILYSARENSSKKKRNQCFRPGSNRGPCACEAHVITTTLRKRRDKTVCILRRTRSHFRIICKIVVVSFSLNDLMILGYRLLIDSTVLNFNIVSIRLFLWRERLKNSEKTKVLRKNGPFLRPAAGKRQQQ